MAEDFFSQMKQVISQGAAAVNRGVSDLQGAMGQQLEIGRHQLHIEGLNRQMQDMKLRLGETVYRGWKDHTLDSDAIRVQCTALGGLESQKQALEDRIAHIRAGAERAEEAAKSTVCPACGAELCEGAVFCHICGAKAGE